MAAALVLGATLTAAACGAGDVAVEEAVADESATAAESSGSGLSGQFDTVDGSSINLADFDGQDVVLWFWAPW